MTTLHHFSLLAALTALLFASSASADEMPVDEPEAGAPAVDSQGVSGPDENQRRFTVGAFVGASSPSRTFGVSNAEVSLDQGFLVGVRAGHRLGDRYDIEIEGTYGTAAVRDTDEKATILAGRASIRAVLNPTAEATLFALAGLGAIASIDAEPAIDNTTRATGHYGVGVSIAVNEMAAVRLEARHVIGRGNDDGLSSMGELHIGGGFAF